MSNPSLQSAPVVELTPSVGRDEAAPSSRLSQPVVLRTAAIVDAARLHLTDDAAVKQNMFTSRPGYPSGMTNMQTSLHVEAWVRNTTYTKSLWIDVHVYEGEHRLVQSGTLPLQYARPAGDGGDLFILDSMLFRGFVATQGSVDLRPDARLVQYRLYGEVEGQIFTDGIPHECWLQEDAISQ